ncbi:hypothetical protein ASE75_12680 [Sphingomonas sp. Leaf17]|uniref:hypothetical protein n=1 Tax=Sphingomonas sp. Leaf17 TaxID=1735683 RepID=UPI0006F7A029|nr:hypothetical protein [Sphingomonas sp. Leaf17]KQM63315.1 hypothetical protein ASE75_12680 [Sphingomonas sp. Leaf17]
MSRDGRRLMAAAMLLAVIALAARHPTADIRLLTHEATDPSPHRLQAAFDFGVVGISIVYTWTVRQLR